MEAVQFAECYGRCGAKRFGEKAKPFWCPICKPKFEAYLGPKREPNRDRWPYDTHEATKEIWFRDKLVRGFQLLRASGDR